MSVTQTEWASGAKPEGQPRLVQPLRVRPAGDGWTWIARGWKLFTRAPLMWILSILVWFVIAIVMNLLPILGGVIFQVLNAAIAAGFMVACRSLENGGDFELEQLFAGFRTRFGSLLVVGLLVIAGYIVILLVFGLFVGFSLLGALLTGDATAITAAVMASMLSLAVGALVAVALTIPLMAAFWFAPALVVLHDVAPGQAMYQSLVGCFRNWIPFLVWSIVMTAFALLAAIPFALGYFVWVPLAITSTYAAYRAIYTEDGPAPAAA